MIFGLLVAFLVITGIGALAVYTGAVDAPFNKGFTTIRVDDELAEVKSPCLPEGTLPVAYAEVQVRVFNGTGKGGLGAANQEILTKRGFTVVLLGDLEDSTGANITQNVTQISYGLAGVAQAYTLAAHYPSPVLVLDDRADATVDVVLGKDFENLVDEELVGLDGAVPLESRKDCVAIETLTPRAAYVPPVPAADVPAEEAPAEEAPAEG